MPDQLRVNCVGRRWIIIDRAGKDTVLHIMWKDHRLATLVLEKEEAKKLSAQVDTAVKRRVK